MTEIMKKPCKYFNVNCPVKKIYFTENSAAYFLPETALVSIYGLKDEQNWYIIKVT